MLINDSEAWKVILADSDQMTIEQVERILETRFQTEFSLFHAPSAEIAERYLSVIQPRIIFLNYLFADSNMGKRTLRMSGPGNQSPVISVVVRPNDWNLSPCSRWVEEGFSTCLTKPLSPNIVYRALQKLIPDIK